MSLEFPIRNGVTLCGVGGDPLTLFIQSATEEDGKLVKITL